MPKKEMELSRNLGWFGVPRSGCSNVLHRLKPGLQTVRDCIVPMHAEERNGAFQEPWLVWSSAFRLLERPAPAEAGTPNGQRLHRPNACRKKIRSFPGTLVGLEFRLQAAPTSCTG